MTTAKTDSLVPTREMPASGESLLDQARARGTLRFAVYDVAYGSPPDMYRDPDTGEQVGVAMDLCAILARDLGVEPEWVELPWDEHLPALLDGRVDICIKHTNTPQRALDVEFAGRLMKFEVVVMVRTDGPIQTAGDLNREGVLITYEEGSSIVDFVRERFPLATTVGLEQEDAMLRVLSGTADACVADTPVPLFVNKHPEVMILKDEDGEPIVLSRELGHPAIRPGDPRFLNWLNNWVDFYDAQGLVDRLWEEHMERCLEAGI